MQRLIVLNAKKPRLVDIQQSGLRFLGLALTWRQGRHGWNHYPNVELHHKSLKKLRDGIREKLNRSKLWRPVDEVISDLHREIKGWAGYFHYGNSTRVMGKVGH